MRVASTIIFVSPVYNRMISAQMKLLLDRLSFLLHRPELAGKQAFLLCTQSYGGAGESLRYFKIPVRNMGIRVVSSLGVLSRAYKTNAGYKRRVKEKLNKVVQQILNFHHAVAPPKPRFREMVYFNKWKALAIVQREHYPGDFHYWENRGLLESNYYNKGVRINPIWSFILPRLLMAGIRKITARGGYFSTANGES
jgi:multimeric flavodoxin WrbA